MDENLQKMIQENNDLIQENQHLIKQTLELAKKNQTKIKKVHSYMRRSFVAKIMYWGIIILVAAGAFYAIRPRVQNLLERYQKFQAQLDVTSHAISNPKSIIDGIIPEKNDIGILNGLFD